MSAFRSGVIGVPADKLAETAVADVASRHVAFVDCRHRPAGGEIGGNSVEPGK